MTGTLQSKSSDCDLDSTARQQNLKSYDVEAGMGPKQHRSNIAAGANGSSHNSGGDCSWSLSPPIISTIKDRSSITASTAAVLSGVLYSISSAALTLLNKKVLVHYDFSAVHALLCFHCMLAVALVQCCSLFGWAQVEPLSVEIVRMWMPVNCIFVAMLATNFYALKLVGVGMVSVLKNLSNLFILCGDYALFGRTYSWHVWVCLVLMAASVVAGGATDVHFTWQGYAWQMANNVFTAGYALYLSRVTERVSNATHDHKPLNQMSMVYYNNMLSIPLTIVLVLLHGEMWGFWRQQALYQPSFQALAVLGGLFGFVLSFSSIWFVSLTTATFYSLVGSFNKVTVAAAGIIYFNEQSGARNLASIAAGLLAGTLLPFIKMRTAHKAADKAKGAAARSGKG
jgi:GDP-mannose transporter